VNAALQLGGLFAATFALTLLAGGPLIAALKRASLRQHAYEDAPKTHAKKTGTPTMGGLLFALGLLPAVVWHPDAETAGLALLGVLCGAIGLVDDLRSIRQGRNRGLGAREKFALTGLVGAVYLALAGTFVPAEARGTLLSFGTWAWHAPLWLWYALCLAAIVATTHAVNLTDGLDGFAAGSILSPLAVFAWLGWRAGNLGVTAIDVALGAATLGFLAFNRHPARCSWAIRARSRSAQSSPARDLTGNNCSADLVGGVFVAETLSVIFKWRPTRRPSRRVFRMSPLHHHFELGGWPETKVTRFASGPRRSCLLIGWPASWCAMNGNQRRFDANERVLVIGLGRSGRASVARCCSRASRRCTRPTRVRRRSRRRSPNSSRRRAVRRAERARRGFCRR
jgi:phospho-N-acetylmuramoyl-pentapeptide-transferase